jgi:hypothetical protein
MGARKRGATLVIALAPSDVFGGANAADRPVIDRLIE